MKRVLGITGLIGAGKSTVVKTFANLYDTPVFDCDSHAKELYRDIKVRETIISKLDFDPILSNGFLDKKALTDTLRTPTTKTTLEAIIHSAVKEKFLQFVSENHSNLIVLESAILFSSSFDKLCQYTAVVKADKSVRKERVLRRDINRSSESYDQVETLQNIEENLQDQSANFIIKNSENHSIIKAVEAIWNRINNR